MRIVKPLFFLAYNEKGTIVGRIAVIINHYEINRGVRKVRFGWLDMIDDLKVTDALLKKSFGQSTRTGTFVCRRSYGLF